MSFEADWRRLDSAIDHWGERQLSFWVRDDDAIEPTPALHRLVRLCAAHGAPLLVAVIPQPATHALAKMIATQPLVRPCQHGYAHINHAPKGERAQELGFRPASTVCDELRVGRLKMQQLFGDRLSNILVPPWNRYDPSIVPGVARLGFQAISGFGRSKGEEMGITRLDTHVDIIDWRKDRRTKPLSDLITILTAEVELAKQSNGQVAILTHHLDHDEAAWDFLERLFVQTRSHPLVHWRDANDFLA